MAGLDSFEAVLGYRFTDRTLVKQALTHRSLCKDGVIPHNQRLEFLGDAVLGLAIADMLSTLYPGEPEGDLSRRLVSLVNGEVLADIGREWRLGEWLDMAPGEEEQGGRDNPSNIEDGCEAVLGAVYRDGGFEAARAVVDRFWKSRAKANRTPPKDPKTALQEWAQGRGLKLPEYRVVSSDGPAHAPRFVIELSIPGHEPVRAEAGTKKLAERQAAEAMLVHLA